MKIFYIIIFSLFYLNAQGIEYAGPDDPAGDIEAEREGYMNGNRVYLYYNCLLYTSPSPRDVEESRMPSSA